MRLITGCLVFAMVLSLTLMVGADVDQLLIPKEAEITPADQAAVDRLEVGKEGIPVKADIRTIQGLATATSGVALNLNQAIIDLKAEVRDNEVLIQLSSDVLFDFDKADIKTEAEPELKKVALIIKEKAKDIVAINGHTDAKGLDDYNLALSVRRAKAIQLWLVEKGGAAADYKVKGYGETQPVASNTKPDGTDNPDGRALNRRVEIVIPAAKP